MIEEHHGSTGGTETHTAEEVIQKIRSLAKGWNPKGSTTRKSGWVRMSEAETQELKKRTNRKTGEGALGCAIDCHQESQGWVFISMARYHARANVLRDCAKALPQSVLLMNLRENPTPKENDAPATDVLSGLRSIPKTLNVIAFPGGVVEVRERGIAWSQTGA